MRMTVHVCTKDRHTELAILLHSLRKQTFQDWDLFILDDASGTGLLKAKFLQDILARIKLEGHDVEVHRNEVSLGVCAARQYLIDADPWKDENPLIMRLDDDCVLEPDYLEMLYHEITSDCISKNVGWASGVTPMFGMPDQKRDTKHVLPVINAITFDKEGNITEYHDDCGTGYVGAVVALAHQFRSMALFKREMFTKGLAYEKGLTPVSFREEAFLSLRAAWMGYAGIVRTNAVGWHAPCPSGGVRRPEREYRECVSIDDERFRKWAKKMFLEKGVPAVWKTE